VVCLNVLLHVTRDDQFEQALINLASAVAPGGHLLLAEPILLTTNSHAPYDPEKHSRARIASTYFDPLVRAGLIRVAVTHGCVLANNPIEAGSPAAMARYRSWWRWVAGTSKTKPSSARWLGPLVYWVDRVAMLSTAAPSTKFALFSRPA
jgi:hypothetical protein